MNVEHLKNITENDNKISNDIRYLGIKAYTFKLWVLGLIVTATLCSSEVIYDGVRFIYTPEQYDNVILSASVAESIIEGQIPPRTSEILFNGIGIPYHQFYSPMSHFIVSVIGILFVDIMLGFTLATMLMMTLAFVYSYKLIKYLTLSEICAVIAAFVFITSPYLSSVRALQGSFAEYCSLCLLPITLYMNLKAANSKKIKYALLAVIITATLALTLLNTFIQFYFYLFIFILVYVLQNYIRKSDNINRKFKKIFLKKFFILALIFALVILVDMFYFLPVLFYDDLILKSGEFSAKNLLNGSEVSILSLFSIFDMPSIGQVDYTPRFQFGFLTVISYFAYIYFLYSKRKIKYYWAFTITSSLILLTCLYSFVFVGKLSNFDPSGFSYKQLGIFEFITTIMGSLVIIKLFRQYPAFNAMWKKLIAVLIILLSFVLVKPYLYTDKTLDTYPKQLTTEMIYSKNKLNYGNISYFRTPPAEEDSRWISKNIPILDGSGNSSRKTFKLNIDDYFSRYNNTDIYFNILYYPGLHDIKILVDNEEVYPNIDTFWRHDDYYVDENGMGGYFHGLKISGLPDSGMLEVLIDFTGNRLGNLISSISVFSILTFVIFYYLSRYRHKKKTKVV